MNNFFIHRPELDEFENEVKKRVLEGKCEGSCEQHVGECEAFRVVSSDGYDWGWFSYCSAAQEEDKNRGFQLFEQTPHLIMKPTITIELDVEQASYLHAMIDPNFFLSSEPLTDMEKAGYNLGIELKSKLATFVQENYS